MNAPVLLKVLFESTKPYVMAEALGVRNSDAVTKLTVTATKQINRFISRFSLFVVNAAVDGRDGRILPLCNHSLKVARARDYAIVCLFHAYQSTPVQLWTYRRSTCVAASWNPVAAARSQRQTHRGPHSRACGVWQESAGRCESRGLQRRRQTRTRIRAQSDACLLYTSDAADERS